MEAISPGMRFRWLIELVGETTPESAELLSEPEVTERLFFHISSFQQSQSYGGLSIFFFFF